MLIFANSSLKISEEMQLIVKFRFFQIHNNCVTFAQPRAIFDIFNDKKV